MTEIQLEKVVPASQVSGGNGAQVIETLQKDMVEVVTTEVNDGLLGSILEVNKTISEPVLGTSAGIRLLCKFCQKLGLRWE